MAELGLNPALGFLHRMYWEGGAVCWAHHHRRVSSRNSSGWEHGTLTTQGLACMDAEVEHTFPTKTAAHRSKTAGEQGQKFS